MSPTTIAMITLIVIGGFTIIAMIGLMYKNKEPTIKSILMVVLGFAMIGVGGFGPAFLNPYGEFIASLQLVGTTSGNAQKAAAQDLVNAYADGEYRDQDWPIIAATLQQYAVPDLDEILLEAEQEVTTPVRKQAIETTREDVIRESAAIDVLGQIEVIRASDDPQLALHLDEWIKKVDNRTLRLIERKPELDRLEIDGLTRERIREELKRREGPMRRQP